MFCKHEIAKLLPKHIARIAKVSLSNWKLLFEEYLLDKASLKILTLPRSRQMLWKEDIYIDQGKHGFKMKIFYVNNLKQ